MHRGKTDQERDITPAADEGRPSKGMAISGTPSMLPGQPKFDRLPDCVRCGLPLQIAAALDNRKRRNILRAFHRGGLPMKLTITQLEADERVDASAYDIWQQVAILTERGLVTLVEDEGGSRDTEPQYASAVAADRSIVAVLTALEAWDELKAAGESSSSSDGGHQH